MRRISIIIVLLFSSVFCFSQVQKFNALIGEDASDNFGFAVSMSEDGSRFAVGGHLNNGSLPGNGFGHVRVYEVSSGGFIQVGGDIDGEDSGDFSGCSVELSANGNRIVIGAFGNDALGPYTGQARVYEYNGYNWVQLGYDINGDAQGDDAGKAVAISADGSRIAIGAWENDAGPGIESGQVRVFEFIASNWVQVGGDILGESYQDRSGADIALSSGGNRIIIGAPYNDASNANTDNRGHARIFEYDGVNWVQLGGDIDGEAAQDQFGRSVDISANGNRVVIGSPYNDGNGAGAGHARAFEYDGISWNQLGVDIDGEAANDSEGNDVAISDDGTRLAIGSFFNSDNGTYAGHVRIFHYIGSNWVQVGLDIDGEDDYDQAGRVAISGDGNQIVIGSPYNMGTGIQEGHVRVFTLKGITGKFYLDLDQNCVLTALESGIPNRLATINPGGYVVQANYQGIWHLDSLPPGTYTLTVDTSGNWVPTCSASQTFTIISVDTLLAGPDIGLISTTPCPAPDVSVFMPFIRPCLAGQLIYVEVQNTYFGTDIFTNTTVQVKLDSLISPTSSSIPYTSLGSNTYEFDIGAPLSPGQEFNFWISSTVNCSATPGQTLCMEAFLVPMDSCSLDTIPADTPPDFIPCSLPWDQSSISVEGWCENDSIYFTITNTGDLGGGDMDCYAPVRLYINGIYIWLDSIQLLGQQTDTLVFSGDGQTWRLEVDQHPLHPGNSNPNATVELCGNTNNWTPGLVNILPTNDADPVIDIYCGEVTASYDPNDKTGVPLGVGTQNLIQTNNQIEYQIRFQNTGTDTAFTVVLRDTLDIDFDIYSVTPGVSSHNYVFQTYGPRVLQWTFNNIELPDSTTNQAGSNGFATFKVNQINDLPDGAMLNNTADIYFDFNSPVITNTTTHQISDQLGIASHDVTKYVNVAGCSPVTYGGLSYDQEGQYYQVIDGGLNTDTLVIVQIIINNSAYTETIVACDTFLWIDGNSYTASINTPTWTLTNAQGCDSLVTLDLTIINSNSSIDIQTHCDSFTWINGNTYTSSTNTPALTLTNAQGCDSIVTLDLTISNSNSGIDIQTHCDSFTWIDGNTYTSSTSSPAWTLTNAQGCDSIITLNLTINNSDPSVTQVDELTIQANTTGALYQWLDCDNSFAMLVGETGQSYSATINGSYAVQVTNNGCIDTSACITITNVGIIENDFGKELVVYPNPTEGLIKVSLGAEHNLIKVEVIDVNGKIMSVETFNNVSSFDVKVKGDAGHYVLNISSDEKRARLKIIKE